MNKINKGTHLSLESRKYIQEALERGESKVAIARYIDKDPSTISKEIYNHRIYKPFNLYGRDLSYFCLNKNCKEECKHCVKKCDSFVGKDCKRRKRIGVCNKCPNISHCFLEKYFYRATQAHSDYLYHLTDSREGVNLTTNQVAFIAEIIDPLLKKGHSVYQIVANHPEIKLSVRSLYYYIESGVFKDYGIDNFSLRRQVSMRKRKKLKSRKEPHKIEGHKYADFEEFRINNPTIPATEMDTVYNNSKGPYIQTFIFEHAPVMIGFLHTEKTCESMSSTLDYLQEMLGNDFYKLFHLILTDRGSEFIRPEAFEVNKETGEIRTNLFYCDPQRPSQKPHVENNHNYVRTILPNGKDLSNLTQSDVDLMFSHINSVPRQCLNGKTPYDVFAFYYGEEILKKLNIKKIEKDEVTLMPYLLNIK